MLKFGGVLICTPPWFLNQNLVYLCQLCKTTPVSPVRLSRNTADQEANMAARRQADCRQPRLPK